MFCSLPGTCIQVFCLETLSDSRGVVRSSTDLILGLLFRQTRAGLMKSERNLCSLAQDEFNEIGDFGRSICCPHLMHLNRLDR